MENKLNLIKQWHNIPVAELGKRLQDLGFSFVKSFSTDEYRLFTNKENTLLVVLERNLGKVYSTKDRKTVLHTFAVVNKRTEQ